MKRLKQFAYFEPTTVAEAIDILVDKGCDAIPLQVVQICWCA